MTPWVGSAQHYVWRNLCEWASGKKIFLGPIDAWRCTDKNVRLRDKRGREDTKILCDTTAAHLELCEPHCFLCVSESTWWCIYICTRSTLDVFLNCLHIMIWVRVSHWTKICLAIELQVANYFHFAHSGLADWAAMPGSTCGYWVSESRFSCFCDKHFISWAISLALYTW